MNGVNSAGSGAMVRQQIFSVTSPAYQTKAQVDDYSGSHDGLTSMVHQAGCKEKVHVHTQVTLHSSDSTLKDISCQMTINAGNWHQEAKVSIVNKSLWN